jgi:hypothetical protein
MADANSTPSPAGAAHIKTVAAAPPTAPTHKLIDLDFTADDVIEALEYLLQEAKRGQIIGLTYGAMMRKRSCIVDAVGEMDRNPLSALGMLSLLQAQIAKRVID